MVVKETRAYVLMIYTLHVHDCMYMYTMHVHVACGMWHVTCVSVQKNNDVMYIQNINYIDRL